MNVPFLDLKAQYLSMKEEIHLAIQQVLDNTAFAGGPFVAQFEKEFAAFCGCKEAIGVGSGTEALWLCLLALGIGPGDEVVTVPNSFIATAEAISFCGATPAFVDVDPRTYTLDPNKLEDYLKRRSQETAVSSQEPKPSNRCLQVPGLGTGQLPGGRAVRRRIPLPSHVPRTHSRAD